jgi:hypothetical protein
VARGAPAGVRAGRRRLRRTPRGLWEPPDRSGLDTGDSVLLETLQTRAPAGSASVNAVNKSSAFESIITSIFTSIVNGLASSAANTGVTGVLNKFGFFKHDQRAVLELSPVANLIGSPADVFPMDKLGARDIDELD